MRSALLLAAVTVPGLAYASDMTGLFSTMFMVLLAAPSAVICFLISVYGVLSPSYYKSQPRARKHTLGFLVAPTVGIALALGEMYHHSRLMAALSIYGLMVLVAFAPLGIYKLKARPLNGY
jgi:hypothetical protein